MDNNNRKNVELGCEMGHCACLIVCVHMCVFLFNFSAVTLLYCRGAV